MPYYNVHIGKQPYKLYIKEQSKLQSYNLFMLGQRKNAPYATVSYTFNDRDNTFHVKLENLSERARYLINKGFLYVVPEIQSSAKRYSATPSSETHKRVIQGVNMVRHVAYNYRNGGKWYASGSNGAVQGQQLVVDGDKELVFDLSQIYECIPHPLEQTIKKLEEHNNTNVLSLMVYKIRFYVYSSRGSGRYHTTICNPFELSINY